MKDRKEEKEKQRMEHREKGVGGGRPGKRVKERQRGKEKDNKAAPS